MMHSSTFLLLVASSILTGSNLTGSSLMAAEVPSPALLVLNKQDNSLAIVDPASGKIAGVVPVGEAPHEVTASADGKLAFVANYGAQTPGNTISVVDLAAQKELRRVDLGPLGRPHGIVYTDGEVYFTAEAAKLIARYDPAGGRIDWMLGTGQNGTHMVLFGAGNQVIFTANIGSNTISEIERVAGQAGWNETQIAVGKGPEGMDLAPDGKELWTAHGGDGGVSIIDPAARKVIQTLDLHTKRSNRLKFTPDGRRVLVSDMFGNELVVVDAASRSEVKRIAIGHGPEGILMAPGGQRAYIAVSGDNRVAVLDLRTLDVTGSFETGRNPDGMAWAASH
jgi:YVTN family beta-propeller protein